jgi:hypothetical protein
MLPLARHYTSAKEKEVEAPPRADLRTSMIGEFFE